MKHDQPDKAPSDPKATVAVTNSTSMRKAGPGFIVLYRWRLQKGMEAQFVEAWSHISRLLKEERGSLGSRLHLGADDVWYSYAQWPSKEVRDSSAALPPIDPEARDRMRKAVREELPEVELKSVSDFLVLPSDA
jgi:hypothetical protein